MMRRMVLIALWAMPAAVAQAGEQPLYQPVPAWVKPAPEITPQQLTPSAPLMLIYDAQSRLQDGQVWSYVDSATRMASAEVVTRSGTLTIPWNPDQGDLIVHRVEIVRGGEHIDLLAGQRRFTVLRREQQLEQLQVNGVLSATMPVEGLRVGDVLRVTLSQTQRDPVLKGQVQATSLLPVAPARIGFSRTRMLWPAADPIQWKIYAEGANPVVTTAGGYREVVVEGALPKPADMPGDMPFRFSRPAMIEATGFADWQAVSRTMAPLYDTKGLIAPGSPLAAEVARIRAADTDPLKRVGLALDLVQDKVRYLYNGMNGGGYRPQAPAETWSLRYGDCKAKTLLLLALLHALDVEAEPVVAPAQAGDVITGRLPVPGAFDHVIVRATVGGEALWLDGTMNGTRLADLHDVPSFRTVLPLRAEGVALMPVPFRAPVRPLADVDIEYDQRAGLTLPGLVSVTMKMRGPEAGMIGLAATQVDKEQQAEIVQRVIGTLIGDARLSDQTLTYDAASGVATIGARGLMTTPWSRDRGRHRMTLDRAVGEVGFEPDRVRAAWRNLPVQIGVPSRVAYRQRVLLPEGGKGYTLAGDATLAETIAGRTITRRATMAGELATTEEDIATVAAEVAPDAVVATRARVALAQGRRLEVVAPEGTLSHIAEAMAARRTGRTKPLLAAYDRAVAQDPADKGAYANRAAFLAGIYDYKAAIPDVTKAIELEPTTQDYLWRAGLYQIVGEPKRQLADLEQALQLEPAGAGPIRQMAEYRVDHGERDAALAMVQERIDAGGKEAATFQAIKADLLARMGRKDDAVAAIDAANAANPGSAWLLNSRCWIKGTMAIQLDTALKDCTRSIELSDNTAAALDSRAMVYYRMGRYDEALTDLTAVLDQSPDHPASLYMRGVVLGRQGKPAEAAGALAAARMISPLIDADYQRWGIKP